MATKEYKPTTPTRRHRVDSDKQQLNSKKPEKSLTKGMKETAGRAGGTISVRHRGGRVKRKYRKIDFKRDKQGVPAKVAALEYDPNRSAYIALLHYVDGEKRYILAPEGLEVGSEIETGEDAEIEVGNALPLGSISLGTEVHNVEMHPGRGGQMVRSAGSSATLVAKPEGKYVHLKLPSGEIHKVLKTCYATVGSVSRPEHKSEKLGKAGRNRYLGKRPTVRGSAMNANSHPHGSSSEGKAGIGMPSPKTPWGKKTLGKKTRTRKHTDKYIVKDRREK
ncbi:MAG: 50S ribosomal protein L2 [Patescibacteria group bacterium]